MKQTWKPGDAAVALPQRSFEPEFMVVRTKGGGSGDYWSAPQGWPQGDNGAEFCDYRPLVVIDPEDREQVERLVRAYIDQYGEGNKYEPNGKHRKATDDMQAGLRSLTADPKPDEPQGLGAVVENDRGRLFVRQVDGWWRGDQPCDLNWSAVHAVKVLSEGVTTND